VARSVGISPAHLARLETGQRSARRKAFGGGQSRFSAARRGHHRQDRGAHRRRRRGVEAAATQSAPLTPVAVGAGAPQNEQRRKESPHTGIRGKSLPSPRTGSAERRVLTSVAPSKRSQERSAPLSDSRQHATPARSVAHRGGSGLVVQQRGIAARTLQIDLPAHPSIASVDPALAVLLKGAEQPREHESGLRVQNLDGRTAEAGQDQDVFASARRAAGGGTPRSDPLNGTRSFMPSETMERALAVRRSEAMVPRSATASSGPSARRLTR